MATKKKVTHAKETVERLLFSRSTYRKSVARQNLSDALKHTNALLAKVGKKFR